MNKRRLLLPALALSLLTSCEQDPPITAPYNGFPVEVGQIFIDNCAQSGCHTDQSYQAEGRLSLESWSSAFQGSSAGSAIIPYRDDYSYLMYFINRDSTLGPVQEPYMPLNLPDLSPQQVDIIRQWIAEGAPSINGNVKFTGATSKFYVANQGCDVVSVLQKNSGLVMRMVDVGVESAIESPHQVKISPDGQYWYSVFLNGGIVAKYRTSDDALVGTVNIGLHDWNTFTVSPDGVWGFAVAYQSKRIAPVNLELLTSETFYSVTEKVHGCGMSPDGNTLYITHQDGNKLYRFRFLTGDPFDVDNIELDEVDLLQGTPPGSGTVLGPHEVAFTPEGDKFAVTCQGSDEVRIYNASDEILLEVIAVGDQPVEMSTSASRKYLFVTCMEDEITWGGSPNKRGSVAVIDYVNMTLVKAIYTGYQPHGIGTDEANGLVYVANRNLTTGGPAPHHSTICGGRNGYLTAIDMNSLDLVPGFKVELAVDPYAVAVKP